MTSVLRYALLVLVWQQASARSAAAQERVITGTVHTRGGIPIEGAHVRMPAARIETVTSAAGAFRLRLPSLVGPSLDTLRVERIGYRSRVSVLQPGDTARHLDVALTEVATRPNQHDARQAKARPRFGDRRPERGGITRIARKHFDGHGAALGGAQQADHDLRLSRRWLPRAPSSSTRMSRRGYQHFPIATVDSHRRRRFVPDSL